MSSEPPFVAVIGGMGPLASAAFVRTIYERTTCRREQEMPRVLLWSDPQLDDRTMALRDGREQALALKLEDAIEGCARAGATAVVICCVTAHALLPLLPVRQRERTMSLIDLLLMAVIQRQRRHLILSSTGTRRSRLLEQHPLWDQARAWLSWPTEAEHDRLHHEIYAMKLRGSPATATALIRSLLREHGVMSFVAACTELHLVTQAWVNDPAIQWIDPLEIVADRIAMPSSSTLTSPEHTR
jgi:aspartate racemase